MSGNSRQATWTALPTGTESPGVAPPDNEVTFWERCARTRFGQYMTAVEHRFIQRAMKLSDPPGIAVEIGCEGGRWSVLLANAGWQLTCADVNAEVLNLCQRRIPSARCVLLDRSDTQIPCSGGSADLMLLIEVWPVVHSSWFLAEAERILKPGGLLIAACANWLSFRGLYSRLRRRREYLGTYLNWRKRLKQHGFEILEAEGFGWVPCSRASGSALVPAFAKAERFLRLKQLTAFSPWVMVSARHAGPVAVRTSV